MWGILISLAIGALCGFLASIIMKSRGGLLFYMITGVLGGFVGSWIFGLIIRTDNLPGQIICGVLGTCLLIFLYRFFCCY